MPNPFTQCSAPEIRSAPRASLRLDRKARGALRTWKVREQRGTPRVSYDDLLDVFWSEHNPTTKNGQGWDIGTQYRSAIFFHDDEQKDIATASKSALEASRRHRRKIVTEITSASTFYPAEDNHQRYLEKRGLATRKI